MAFKFCDAMIDQYLTQGYLNMRGIVPPSLLGDLRRQADIARNLAHALNGPQTQRLQPLDQYSDKIEVQPFLDYIELAALRDAITRLLGPGYTHGHLHIMGLLVEPRDHPWHCGWHRDGVVETPPAARDTQWQDVLDEVWHDIRFFNQINCALYADSCTWFVPGSHLRSQDLPGEMQSTDDPSLRQIPTGRSAAAAERFYLEHCEQMPGALQIHLAPGDFLIYRNLGWHTGSYVPYQPRATIHDIVSHADRSDWAARWEEEKKVAVARLEQRQRAMGTKA